MSRGVTQMRVLTFIVGRIPFAMRRYALKRLKNTADFTDIKAASPIKSMFHNLNIDVIEGTSSHKIAV